jgi:superfamily II DNA or RNA helicase
MQSPVVWALRKFGLVRTSQGIVSLSDAVHPALAESAWAFPVAYMPSESADLLQLPRIEKVESSQWDTALLLAEDLAISHAARGSLYGLAARNGRPAEVTLVCSLGGETVHWAREEVVATDDPARFEALSQLETPVVLVPNGFAQDMVEHWGLRSPDSAFSGRVDWTPAAEQVALVDIFPSFRGSGIDEELQAQASDSLVLVTTTDAGSVSSPAEIVVTDAVVYFLDSIPLPALVRQLVSDLGLSVDDGLVADLASEQSAAALADRRRAVSESPSVGERLIRAAGREQLLRLLPAEVVSSLGVAVDGELDDRTLGDVSLAVHGVEILDRIRPFMETNELAPPKRFDGSMVAQEFVAELDLPLELAGFEPRRYSHTYEVYGPTELSPLHPYQEYISERLQVALQDPKNNRGLLSLPTGAGKTRVAVQGLIEWMRERPAPCTVLWIAQTEELCEQAVQSWAQVWRATGTPDRLTIGRLWTRNEVQPTDDGYQVVVATMAKLGHVITALRYDWLSDAAAVLIDEAHSSTAPSYTAVLTWLGLDRLRASRPLIGLTATPFRGRSEQGTEQLINRYFKHRLDFGAFAGDPYEELQAMGVLARVNHQVLAGTRVELTDAELDHLTRLYRLPASVEERIGSDADRNSSIVQSIVDLDVTWTILVFAASVRQAEVLAALLSLAGVPARAISATTDRTARRHYIESFRASKIRVLTNYGVLTEGFDAPAVRAVYVGRPTFSPNLYQQMIGRGLRGELNGGKAECLIVDIADNIARYGGSFAFTEFESLWHRSDT